MTTGWKIFRLSRIQVENEYDEKMNRSIKPIAGCSPIIRFLRRSNNSVIIFIDTVRERKRHVLEEMAGYSNIECLQWNFLLVTLGLERNGEGRVFIEKDFCSLCKNPHVSSRNNSRFITKIEVINFSEMKWKFNWEINSWKGEINPRLVSQKYY